MTSKTTFALAALLAAAAASGCAGSRGPRMQRVDPRRDDPIGGTMIDSADVIAATDRAAADIAHELLKSDRNDLVVAFPQMKNESIQPINTALFSDRIRSQVVRDASPRVKFLAREHLDEVMKEREGKRTGVFSGADHRQLLGADFLLTGRIKSLSKRTAGDRADYFEMTFTLVDAETSVAVWDQTYEFKKIGDSGTIYQ